MIRASINPASLTAAELAQARRLLDMLARAGWDGGGIRALARLVATAPVAAPCASHQAANYNARLPVKARRPMQAQRAP